MNNISATDFLWIVLIAVGVLGYKMFYATKSKSRRHKGKKEIENTYKTLQQGMFSDIVENQLGPNWVHVSNRCLENGSIEDIYHWLFDYAVDKGKIYSARIECRFIDNKLEDKKIIFIK